MAASRIRFGVGAHEPIFHRLRTGNATADEWERWHRETSEENLDLLERLGVTRAEIACTKGFGLEYEKPLVDRAAKFAEAAARRGIETSAYVQGFPVYYETFLLELPEAREWLARDQHGEYIPWGAQTFRRWMDPTRREFWEYEKRILSHILERFHPAGLLLDNTVVHPVYTDSARDSFRAHLRTAYDESAALREFGIQSFDEVDLPRFDPIYWPRDAYAIVKDPILQEWARWRSRVTAEFCAELRAHVQKIAPSVKLISGCGCEGLRYNQLFVNGVDYEDRIDSLDGTGMEESGWRPGVVETAPLRRTLIMDERTPEVSSRAELVALRVSTDSRFMKILHNYGQGGSRGLWGEFDRASKLVAVSHNLAFAADAMDVGTLGPLAADARMKDDLADVISWIDDHASALEGRRDRYAPVAVWRGTATIAFVRHRPVWEACAIEQMLYEHHVPFTVLLDGGLERFLAGRRLLILPGTSCVSDAQMATITEFVERGGSLLLLGAAGTRDERTRVRSTHAFAHVFGNGLSELERIGPPHWVPELDISRLPASLAVEYGEGRAVLIRDVTPPHELDLTRDVYMPERQVAVADIVPPRNESEIMASVNDLVGSGVLRVSDAPRWTLCEYWVRDDDMVVCVANLRSGHDGGPVTIDVGESGASAAEVHTMLHEGTHTMPIIDGRVRVERVEQFAAIVLRM